MTKGVGPARAAAAIVAVAVSWATWGGALGADAPPYGGAASYLADLAMRRARTMAALGPDAALVLWSAPPRVYSADINYEYRQDSNLLYLTGLEQPDTILVLVPGARTARAVVFTRAADPRRELWDGHVLTPPEIAGRSGIATVYPERGSEAFDAFIAGLLGGTGYRQSPDDAAREFGPFFDALKAGRARIAVAGAAEAGASSPAESADADEPGARAAPWPQRYGVRLVDARPILAAERRIKTPYEQQLLTRSVQISAQAHVEGMKAARPGRWEYEVRAAIESWSLKHGAMSWGYPSIVASGPNATTLHYLKSTRQMLNGELLLVDAAANYQGLTGDITRTYPVNGRFSARQRALYDVVIAAQDAGIAAAKPGAPPEAVTRAVRGALARGLSKIGLITPAPPPWDENAQVGLWCPHDPIHGIGMDVHDPLGALDPGSAFVIEPGVYVRPDALDVIPASNEIAATLERIRSARDEYLNLGVRVEDSFLMTTTGPVMLSAAAPRRVADIERVMGRGR